MSAPEAGEVIARALRTAFQGPADVMTRSTIGEVLAPAVAQALRDAGHLAPTQVDLELVRQRDALARDVADRWEAMGRSGVGDETLAVTLDHLADAHPAGGVR